MRRTQLDDLYAFMQTQLRNNEQMVDRLAQRWARVVMKQTLVDWKKIIVRKKYTRVLLEKTSGRWSKQRMLRLLRRWADYAGAEKIRKIKLQLAHCQENKHDFQDLLVKLEQQIESARQDTKTNREHVNFAKREILGLEDLLHQLDLRVHQSNERKLQRVVNQWGRLCFAFVDCECLYLQNMLDAVSMAQYVDATVLAVKGEEVGELLNLPSDVLVLRWINFQLSQCPTFQYCAPSSAGFIQNFTSDMHNHYVLRHILQRILAMHETDHPSLRRMSAFVSRREGGMAASDPSDVSDLPFANREELRAALSEKLDPGCPRFLSDQVVDCDAAGDLMFCLFSFLVCEHPSLSTSGVFPGSPLSSRRPPATTGVNQRDSPCPWQDAQLALNDARAVWESVRVQWTELQTPFEIQENTKTTPDVTSPPQVLVKANIALQNAVNMVQYACSKRSVVMKMWSCVQRKIQQDALRLLLRRGRKEPPMVLTDRRMWREKYMLTTLHTSKLVAQFFSEKEQQRHYEHKQPAAKEALELELQEVEAVLEEHYEALRRVYRYYAAMGHSRDSADAVPSQQQQPASCTTTPSQQQPEDDEERFFQKISMSMSLLEFHAFLKDCRFFGATRPFPYAFIQRVFEQVNADVAAGTDAATLAPPGQKSAAMEDARSDSNTSEMTPAEFVEALLHIARSKYVSFKSTKAVDRKALPLALRVRKCIEEIILPNAMQEQEQGNVFRPQLLTAECREVFTKHQKKLAALYLRFASLEDASNTPGAATSCESSRPSPSRRKMLSATGLVHLCRHFDLFRDNFLNLDDIQHVLAAILQLERESIAIHGDLFSAAVNHPSDDFDGSAASPLQTTVTSACPSDPSHHRHRNDDDDEELFLTYAEYVEALAAIACYLRPDAFVPLATKLDEFCLEQLHFGLNNP